MEYKVSVIVPIYNIRMHISRCAESLMRQTLKEVEFIFIDDCSQDDSYEVLTSTLSQFPERMDDVRIIRHEVNKGLTKTRNDGIEIATGQFIAHCDGDDWVEPCMYEKMYDKAMSEDAELVICNFFFVYRNETLPKRYQLDFQGTKKDLMASYMRDLWNTVWSMLVSKDIYDRSGHRSPEDITFTEDFHLTVRLLHESRKTAWIDEPLYYYNRANTSSITHGITPRHQLEEIRCCEQVQDWLKKAGYGDSLDKEMGWRLLKSLGYLVLENRFDEFRNTHPECHRYVLSVPENYVCLKVKILMVLTLLHMDSVCRWDNKRHGR